MGIGARGLQSGVYPHGFVYPRPQKLKIRETAREREGIVTIVYHPLMAGSVISLLSGSNYNTRFDYMEQLFY